ncbi:MAG: hypothetical protein ACMXX8_03705, partial [Candidatus Woesearchaeota archaeon]
MKKIILIFLILIIFSIQITSFEDDFKNKKLPIYNLEIPQTEIKTNIYSSSKNFFDKSEDIRIIVILKEPETIWKNEISSFSKNELNGLKST